MSALKVSFGFGRVWFAVQKVVVEERFPREEPDIFIRRIILIDGSVALTGDVWRPFDEVVHIIYVRDKCE